MSAPDTLVILALSSCVTEVGVFNLHDKQTKGNSVRVVEQVTGSGSSNS